MLLPRLSLAGALCAAFLLFSSGASAQEGPLPAPVAVAEQLGPHNPAGPHNPSGMFANLREIKRSYHPQKGIAIWDLGKEKREGVVHGFRRYFNNNRKPGYFYDRKKSGEVDYYLTSHEGYWFLWDEARQLGTFPVTDHVREVIAGVTPHLFAKFGLAYGGIAKDFYAQGKDLSLWLEAMTPDFPPKIPVNAMNGKPIGPKKKPGQGGPRPLPSGVYIPMTEVATSPYFLPHTGAGVYPEGFYVWIEDAEVEIAGVDSKWKGAWAILRLPDDVRQDVIAKGGWVDEITTFPEAHGGVPLNGTVAPQAPLQTSPPKETNPKPLPSRGLIPALTKASQTLSGTLSGQEPKPGQEPKEGAGSLVPNNQGTSSIPPSKKQPAEAVAGGLPAGKFPSVDRPDKTYKSLIEQDPDFARRGYGKLLGYYPKKFRGATGIRERKYFPGDEARPAGWYVWRGGTMYVFGEKSRGQ